MTGMSSRVVRVEVPDTSLASEVGEAVSVGPTNVVVISSAWTYGGRLGKVSEIGSKLSGCKTLEEPLKASSVPSGASGASAVDTPGLLLDSGSDNSGSVDE